LSELLPDGIDLYFDNVGGNHLEAAISSMKTGGRIALCGAITSYNSNPLDAYGPRNLMDAIFKGLTLRGFLSAQFAKHWDEFFAEVAPLVQNGTITVVESIYEGIEFAPNALIDLLTGESNGKVLVRMAD